MNISQIIMTESEMNMRKEWQVGLQEQSPLADTQKKGTEQFHGGWSCSQTAWANMLAS